jgi:hypothetical protein
MVEAVVTPTLLVKSGVVPGVNAGQASSEDDIVAGCSLFLHATLPDDALLVADALAVVAVPDPVTWTSVDELVALEAPHATSKGITRKADEAVRKSRIGSRD